MQALLARICDGHSIEWDGSNMVGQMSDAGQAAVDELLAGIEAEVSDSDWSLWDVGDWLANDDLGGLNAATTDDEMGAIAAEIESAANHDHVVLAGSVEDYLREKRSEMQDDE